MNTYLICQYMFKNRERFSIAALSYETRTRNQLQPEFQRLSLCQHTVNFTGPSEWNKLSQTLKTIGKFSAFKKALKNYLKGNYMRGSFLTDY